MIKSVPQRWRGVWRRLALERADGSTDTESLVLWLQTETLFADIRVPHSRPDFSGVEDFADLGPEQAAFLARQDGFAGVLHAAGDQARWERRIDFNPPAATPDEAKLSRSRRMLVATGVHSNSIEHWWCEDPWGASDTEILINRTDCILLRASGVFLYAEERRANPPAPGTLAERVAEAECPEEFAALLNCEISVGTISDDGWRIGGSTLPWREGAEIDPE